MFHILKITSARQTLRVCLAVFAAALLTLAIACGDDDDGASPTVTASTEASPEDSGDAASRTPQGSPVTTPGGTSGLPVECTAADAQRGLLSHVDFSGDDGIFSPGEEIEMTQTVVNCGDKDTVLNYLTAQRYVVIIENADTAVVVWDSSEGKAFEQTLGEETIGVGETRVYTETWDQKDAGGEQAPAGMYKLSFFNVGCAAEAQPDCKFGSVKQLLIE